MVQKKVDTPHGFSLSLSTTNFDSDDFEVVSFTWSGIAREAFETSHLQTAIPTGSTFGNKTFLLSDLTDPGELQLTIHFDPSVLPAIDVAADTITGQWWTDADIAGTSWSASGGLTNMDVNGPDTEGKMTADITFKLSGNVTVT